MNKVKAIVPLLLLISAINLTVMVPGGPVETRQFSQITPWILGAFNIFLTSLGMLTFVVAITIFFKRNSLYLTSAILGVCYFLVYVLDLLKIFPLSIDAMPLMLKRLEIFGTILSIPLIGMSIHYAKGSSENSSTGFLIGNFKGFNWRIFLGISTLVLIGTIIVVFATYSVMGK